MEQPPVTDISNLQINDGRWTDEEHRRFLEGLTAYGKDWKKIQEIVPSRTGSQIRSHAQKYFNKLERHRELACPDPDSSSGKRKFPSSAALPLLTESANLETRKSRVTRHHPQHDTQPTKKKRLASDEISEYPSLYNLNSLSMADTASQSLSFFEQFIPRFKEPGFLDNFLSNTTDIPLRKHPSRPNQQFRSSFEDCESSNVQQKVKQKEADRAD